MWYANSSTITVRIYFHMLHFMDIINVHIVCFSLYGLIAINSLELFKLYWTIMYDKTVYSCLLKKHTELKNFWKWESSILWKEYCKYILCITLATYKKTYILISSYIRKRKYLPVDVHSCIKTYMSVKGKFKTIETGSTTHRNHKKYSLKTVYFHICLERRYGRAKGSSRSLAPGNKHANKKHFFLIIKEGKLIKETMIWGGRII